MLEIGEAASGQTIDLPVGQVMELRLKENPTTGYRWRINQDGSPSCRISDAPSQPAIPGMPSMPGAGSTHVWRIEGAQVGLCSIEMQYIRPWETDRPPAMTFGVRIRVQP